MNETNIFDEYLVKLGFDPDPAGYAKFISTLTGAANIAEGRTESIIKSIGKWQGAIVGGFAAIGAAAVGIADKIADADLGYQLFATRMFMSVDAAKQLSIATDVLGHSLDEVAWSPELHARFDVLLSDQERMAAVLGHGFEPGLRNIRDIRFQFSRMQDELEYGLLPEIVSQVSKGLGGPDLLDRLQKVNDWVISHIPEIASEFSKYLVPVLKDGKRVLGDVIGMLEDTGVAFTNLIGYLADDKSIEGTTFSFDKLFTAVDHVSHAFAKFVGYITTTERMLAHVISGIALAGDGDFKGAGKEFSEAWDNVNAGSSAATGAVIGSVFGPEGTLVGGAIGAVAGKAKTYFESGSQPEHGFTVPNGIGSSDIHALIDKLAPQYGINAATAHAVAMQESGERQVDVHGALVRSSTGAQGVFQLMPDTARSYGVNAGDASQNVSGGLRLLADLSKRYGGNLDETLAAYNWGSGHLDKAIAKYGRFDESFLPQETRDYIRRIEGNLAQQGEINVPVTVIVHGDADGRKIGQEAAPHIREAIREAMQKANQSNIAQLSGRYQ